MVHDTVDSVALSPAETPSQASATTLPSLNAVVENATGHVSTPSQHSFTPAIPAAVATTGTPVSPNTDPALVAPDSLALPDLDGFDWSEFDTTMAAFNTTIPFKAPGAPLAQDGLFSSFLEELAADLPNYITPAVPATPVSTSPEATAVSLPALPTIPVLTSPEATAVSLSALPVTPILTSPVVPVAPDLPIPSSPVVPKSNTQTSDSSTDAPGTGLAPSAAEGTASADLGPLTDIDDPTVLPLRPRKRDRDVTEDPAFIVTGKRVRKPSERKEWKTMTMTKGKENKHPKKGKGSKRTKAM